MSHQQTASLALRGAIRMRSATDDTAAEIIPVVAAAFGETFADAEIEHELKTWEVDRIFGAFDGDRTVGMCGIYTFRLTTPGGEVPAAGLTLVGVLPGERRRGILTTMMRDMIADARARGEPVAVLLALRPRAMVPHGVLSGALRPDRG